MSAIANAQKQNYPPGEAILIDFSGYPGYNDWIGIAKVGDPDDQCENWQYTGRKESGSLHFDGLPAGNYEVRGFFNWKAGGYTVETRSSFNVDAATPTAAKVQPQKPNYSAGEAIMIDYSNFPATRDWVSLAKVGDPDEQCKYWEFTDRKESGTVCFYDGLPAGNYEARGYFNWKSGGYIVTTRCQFDVGPA